MKKSLAILTSALILSTSLGSVYANEKSSTPEENIPITEMDQTEIDQKASTVYKVTADGVRMRSNHSISASVVKTLNKGYVVTYSSVIPTWSSDGYIWRYVNHNGTWGWVADNYLSRGYTEIRVKTGSIFHEHIDITGFHTLFLF